MGLRSAGKDRRDEIYAPDWAAFIKLALFPEEGRCIATKDPDVGVGGLLADHGGNDARDATELNLDAVVRCFVTNASDGDRIAAISCNDDMDEPRFGGRRHHRKAGRRGSWIEVQQ